MAERASGLGLEEISDRAAGGGARVTFGMHQPRAVVQQVLAGDERDLTEDAHQPDQLGAPRAAIAAPRMDGTAVLREHDVAGGK
jgi:hypothetical protein